MSRKLQLLAGTKVGFLDGGALSALFDQPCCVSLAPNGNIWIVDRGNVRIRCLVDETLVSSLTGTRFSPYQVAKASDPMEPVSASTFHVPNHLSHGRAGEAFVVDSGGSRVRKMLAGSVLTVVEATVKNYQEGWSRLLSKPNAVRVDAFGNVWIANTGLKEVLLVRNAGEQSLAGTSMLGWKGGVAFNYDWKNPLDIAFSVLDSSKVFIADDCAIKIIDRYSDEVTWYAGQTESGYRDGWRGEARFTRCDHLLACPNGDLLVIDGPVFRRISILGVVSTFVGPTSSSLSLDALFLQLLTPPLSSTSESAGHAVHVAETPQSIISKPTFEGVLVSPGSSCFNRLGDLIIPDSATHRLYTIRMAQVPDKLRFQLDPVERTSMASYPLKTNAARLLTHKASGASWNVIETTFALATRELLDVNAVASFLEASEMSADAIESFLNMLAGIPPTFPSWQIAVETLVRYYIYALNFVLKSCN